jgi:hypothetical protein
MRRVLSLAQLPSRSNPAGSLYCLSGWNRPGLAAAVQTQKDYSWSDVRFGERFVEMYTCRHGGLTDRGLVAFTILSKWVAVRGNGYDESSDGT